jgi:hypothetical protein
MLLFFQTPPLACRILVVVPLTLLSIGRSEIRSKGNGEVAVDEAGDNFDRAPCQVGLALVDGTNGVAQVEIAVVCILQFLNGEAPMHQLVLVAVGYRKGRQAHAACGGVK